MGSRLLLLLTVCSSVLAFSLYPSSPVQSRCLKSTAGVKCWCKEVNKTTHVFCSCLPVKIVDLKSISQDDLARPVSVFHLQNCSNISVLVFPRAFSDLDYLQDLNFYQVGGLILEHNSIDLKTLAKDVFTLTFSLITNLSIRKDAINIQPHKHHEGLSVKIKHSSINSLMKSAITGKLLELRIENTFMRARPWSEAIICQGDEGASVIMKSVTIKRGLSARWISGNISTLSITRSNLRLLPNAFAAVRMMESQNSRGGISLSENNFMLPFLPSHVFPSEGFLLDAHSNRIVCECQNLVWLLEPPNSQIKEGVKASLLCQNNSLDSVLASCNKRSLSIA